MSRLWIPIALIFGIVMAAFATRLVNYYIYGQNREKGRGKDGNPDANDDSPPKSGR